METWVVALERQRRLQECLAEKQGRGTFPSPREFELALKVELGELLQKVKARWAWWKRGDKAFSEGGRKEILEELADALHFVLGAALLIPDDRIAIKFQRIGAFEKEPAPDLVDAALGAFRAPSPWTQFVGVLALARSLGFSEQALLEAYLEKSRVNLERWGARDCLEE